MRIIEVKHDDGLYTLVLVTSQFTNEHIDVISDVETYTVSDYFEVHFDEKNYKHEQ